MGKLTDADRAAVDLWTAHPMQFHEGKGVFRTIPRFTPCRKPAYTQAMRDDLDRYLERHTLAMDKLAPGDFWAFVDLEGKRRTLRRSDVLSRRQYDEIRSRERTSLGALRAKSQRPVGEGDADGGADPAGVAATASDRARDDLPS